MKRFKIGRIISVALILAMLSIIVIASALAIGSKNSEAPELKIIGTNLSFNDSIYIKYAVNCANVDEIDDVKLLVWTSPSEGYLYGTQNAVLSSVGSTVVNGEDCIVFDYKGLSAKQMTDYIYARAYYESNGNKYYSEVKKYSVLTYVYNKLGYTGTPTENEKLAALLRGMLEYGASAQNYFDYKTDALATDSHVQFTILNGTLSDGSNKVLAVPGTKLTITARTPESGESFKHWEDATGKIISYSQTFTVTVGATNQTLSAVFVSNQGGKIEGAGSNLSSDSFAMTEHNVDTSNAIEVTGSEFNSLLSSGLTENAVYRITDGTLRISKYVNGNNAVVVAGNGVVIQNASDISVNNLIILGSVSIVNSNGVTLNSVEIQSTASALSIDSTSYGITINDSRLIAYNTAITNSAANTTVKSSYIDSNIAISSNANGLTVYNSQISSTKDGIITSGEDVAINNNTLIAGLDSEGISINSSLNTLVSYNIINGPETAVEVTSSTNSVVLFNSCYNVSAKNNTNTYIVENSLGGALVLENNNYLLCDENTYFGNNDHTPKTSGNDNVNGNNLMDVTARNEVGAKEELLPHTNKDLFLEMEKKTTVKDAAGGTSLSLNDYVETEAKNKSVVIVPPGAYYTVAGDPMNLTEAMSNTEIYAFGVYNEHEFVKNVDYLTNKKGNRILQITNAENITIHGFVMGYDYQASGQVHVLEKRDNNQILVVPAAGYSLADGFGQSNEGVFHKSYTTKFASGQYYPALGGSSYTFVESYDDGTILLKLNETTYKNMNVGDIITCRLAGDNQQSISISSTTNIKIKDFTFHGYSAALAVVVGGNSTNTSLERFHNTSRSPYVIDKETYDMYAAWETQYNVDLEISIDGEGRYRGAQPRICSVDATHVTGASEGLDIESCLFENMCDDGSNQRGSSSRLLAAKDNGDGTTTLYIKGMVTSTYHNLDKSAGKTQVTKNASSFRKDDKIYVYTSNGELLCDTYCLTASKDEDDYAEIYDYDGIRYFIFVKSVKVPTAAVNFEVLEGYDLSDNHYDMKNKVLVDNISYVSEGFVIDNLVVRNSTSRGVLIKTINATVKNSTFRNVAGTGNLLSVETSWGESTVSRNIVISGVLFDNTGFDTSEDIKAPISISSLATYGNATVDTLRSSNILITGCEFKDYGHNFGIYVNGARDVRILDNVFDPEVGAEPGNFIKIVTALDILIEDNKYRKNDGTLEPITGILAEDYTYIHGKDVGDTFLSDCDIIIGVTHLSNMRVHPANKMNKDIADSLASKLKNICGYSISSSSYYSEYVIELVAMNSTSDTIGSSYYTITCDGINLYITAATRSALIYAIDDFASYIAERNKTEQTIIFEDGFSMMRQMNISTIDSTDTSKIKYTGLWLQSGDTMISSSDADYLEFDVTGNSFTLTFSEASTFELFIDEKSVGVFTAETEFTYCLEAKKHTVKVQTIDKDSKVSFAGIQCVDSIIEKTPNKGHYILFVGDSMVDGDKTFAHVLGDLLGWDYAVLVGDTLPSYTDTGRKPDLVFFFHGTDAITSSTTSDEQTAFVNAYTSLINSVKNSIGSSAKIYIMQALSTSNASDMFNTSHARYQAIQSVQNAISGANNISSSTVKGWNIEFDSSKDATNPTDSGYSALIVKLVSYLKTNLGETNYYNYEFPLNSMKNYNGTWENQQKWILGTRYKEIVENGIKLNRYKFDKNGHVFISGTDYADVTTNSGNYLVLMYKSSGDYSISLNLRTNDYGTGLAGTNYVSTVTKPQNYVKVNEWEVAVVDLSQFKNYTTGTNIGVQVRITTTLSQLDIACATIVETLADANVYAMVKLGVSEYTYYENWSKKGERVSLSGQDIVEEPAPEKTDLSYVNHNFNLLVMKMYNGSSIVNPSEIMHIDDNGLSYNVFNFSKTGHIFLKGSNTLVPINRDTGNYLVIKYKAANNSYLSLEMQTSDLSFNSSTPYKTLTTLTKSSGNIPDGWEVAVIDLSKFPSYQRDSDLDVLIRITTACEYVHISYAAIVDDVAEAEKYVGDMGDSSYVYYEDWSKTGTATPIN